MNTDDNITLAGDRMKITDNGDGTTVISFDNKGTGRVCGSCQLCCKLLPMPALAKPAGQKCKFQRFAKGCTIYATRPMACKTWACRWLADPSLTGMPRPDRCHYVIDMMEDYVTMEDPATGKRSKLPAFQVWVDPGFPNAHRAPELREWMNRMGEQHGAVTIIRWSATDGMTVAPPAMTGAGWMEWRGQREPEHAMRVSEVKLEGETLSFSREPAD